MDYGGIVTIQNSPQQRLGKRILAARLRKGWNLSTLAANARISRTTLFQMERGSVLSPRAATLHRLAVALEIPLSQLHLEVVPPNDPPSTDASPRREENSPADFDRHAHPHVDAMVQRFPHVFSGFTRDDWGELYGRCTSSASLSDEILLGTAANIAHKRETLRRLSLLLQSHLAPATAAIVNCLFDLIPGAGSPYAATASEAALTARNPSNDTCPPE